MERVRCPHCGLKRLDPQKILWMSPGAKTACPECEGEATVPGRRFWLWVLAVLVPAVVTYFLANALGYTTLAIRLPVPVALLIFFLSIPVYISGIKMEKRGAAPSATAKT